MMIAFDTNLLVRIAVNDDIVQANIALEFLENNEVFISRTVILETEWVLRSIHKKTFYDIADFFAHVLITENIFIENAIAVKNALEWYKTGADFADAIHLSACGGYMMHTFDTEYCKEAKRLGIAPDFKVLGTAE
jgi:predicted nucleic-acid-binding protein